MSSYGVEKIVRTCKITHSLIGQYVMCQGINYCRVSSYSDEKIVGAGKISHSFDKKNVSAVKRYK